MSKVKRAVDSDGNFIQLLFQCPGCNDWHGVDSKWAFNGNIDRPTFSPSVLVTIPGSESRCHSFVNNGNIEFLGDCTHKLANQTIELPEVSHV